MKFQPIGTIRSPYKVRANMPRQGALSPKSRAHIDIDPKFTDALSDIGGFSHLHILFYLHLSGDSPLKVVPFFDDAERGVFSTRAPRRPNPIGLTVVGLERVEGLTLHITGADMVDGTPVLDIKPYIPLIDCHPKALTGWIGDKMTSELLSDERFGR